MTQYHLGISAFYHDSAAALVGDGRIVAAAQQERFSRIRHDSGFPEDAIRYCLATAGIRLGDLSTINYYEDPKLKLGRTLSSFASAGPAGLPAFRHILPEWIRWKGRATDVVAQRLKAMNDGVAVKVLKGAHHRSHAASAFYPSPFERAAVLCVDGVGEWHTTTIWHGKGRDLTLANAISYPHSLGLLYSAFTYFCGFKVDSGEYKLMGLAPYGRPIHADKIRDNLIELRDDGSFSLNMAYFGFLQGQRMVGERFARLFGRPRREPESELTQGECDLAASVQKVTTEAVIGLARAAKAMTGENRLCLAGGVALNCVANGELSRAGLFDEIWIQPAAGDAGCALGVALDQDVQRSGRRLQIVPGQHDAMRGALLGPSYDDDDIASFLEGRGAPYRRFGEDRMLETTAEHLAKGGVVGWFQGRMEFGPRSLGARSIIGDPRNVEMQKTMNLKIKFRESFRPFAPAVLAEKADDYFDMRQDSPYMLVVSPVLEKWCRETSERGLGSINEVRSQLPAITHVDNSARVQTVHEETNPQFHRLLRRFEDKTGCPVLVNTSFNVRGEPIVCTPEEAYTCFMRTNMDVLVLGNCVLVKNDQPPLENDVDWRNEIALD
ncbi:carbamoyltransferase [Breoghania corrubedonensis]|uniref:Carbamoyltransferase n=1 Tax=Breoghania corrubedonensis TaxID=665038 RepID=A0A2T5VA33_9HYPH|nr:carbamoyltransferase [Breoghania corrubedonensis]PTW60617.1 carbamoyltransferase [Breoghania corrubedonensis]